MSPFFERRSKARADAAKDLEFLYEKTRDHIKHEDNLSNNRMNYLLAIQSLLFAAFGVTLNAETTSRFTNIAAEITSIRYMIISVGIASSIIVLFSLYAAHLSIQRLIDRWHDAVAKVSKQRIETKYPNIIGNDIGKRRNDPILWIGQAPILMPFVYYGAWTAVLASQTPKDYRNYAIVACVGLALGLLSFLNYLSRLSKSRCAVSRSAEPPAQS